MAEKEVERLQEGAAKGDPECLYQLAMRHIYGNGVPEDNDYAFLLLQKAASAGHIEAKYNLGICYPYGFGTGIDLQKAYDLYLESAQASYGKGMDLVGRFFNRGIYVKQDRAKAEYWLYKAIESTDIDAVTEAQRELEVNK